MKQPLSFALPVWFRSCDPSLCRLLAEYWMRELMNDYVEAVLGRVAKDDG